MKDHEKAALVNKLRDIAIEFHATGQLRARIQDVLLPALAASGGNAAPEIPKITRYSIYEDHGRTNMMDDDDGDYVHILDHTEQIIAYGKACAAASAPNAALVAITEEQLVKAARYLSDFQCDQTGINKDDAWNIYGSSDIELLRAALSAAGQEVGHG